MKIKIVDFKVIICKMNIILILGRFRQKNTKKDPFGSEIFTGAGDGSPHITCSKFIKCLF